jgi:hypothetical protein
MAIGAILGGVNALAGLGIAALSGKKKAQEKADAAIEGIQTYDQSPYGKANMLAAEADINAAMPGEEEAKMNLGQSATQMLGAAKTRKGALGSIGSIQKQQTAGLQDLATKKAQYKLGAKQRLSGERTKAFSSTQEKQQLKAQQALAKASAANQMQSQGLAMLGKGLGTAAQSYMDKTSG